jgi:hypothetical protein
MWVEMWVVIGSETDHGWVGAKPPPPMNRVQECGYMGLGAGRKCPRRIEGIETGKPIEGQCMALIFRVCRGCAVRWAWELGRIRASIRAIVGIEVVSQSVDALDGQVFCRFDAIINQWSPNVEPVLNVFCRQNGEKSLKGLWGVSDKDV